MQTSQQPYTFSTFKAPSKASNSAVSSSIVNSKRQRQALAPSNKQPLQSRYAQGLYNPTAENEKKLKSGISSSSSSIVRKHLLENAGNGEQEDLVVYPSTKRVKTALPSHPAADVVELPAVKSYTSATNVVAAAKLSLKEKQVLKEKRIKRTGLGMKAKSGTYVRAPAPLPNAAHSARPPSQPASSQMATIAHDDIHFKKVQESRRDSRYNSIVNVSDISASSIRQPLDESLMVVDGDLLPVHINAVGKPKTIHVARASQKWSSSRIEVEKVHRDKEILPVEKSTSSSSALIPSAKPATRTLLATKESISRPLRQHNAAVPLKTAKTILEVSSTTLQVSLSLSTKKRPSSIPKSLAPAAPSAPIALKKAKRTSSQRKLAIPQDPILAQEYAEEIYVYWREIELSCLPDPSYMLRQTELDWGMRATLLAWLVQVHSQFKLLPETLYLTVNLIDRTLSLKLISLSKLQLVGVTALLIASKYEEILSPSVQDLVYMTDNGIVVLCFIQRLTYTLYTGYTSEEILRAERHMLSITGYQVSYLWGLFCLSNYHLQIGYCNPLNFLKRVSSLDVANKQGGGGQTTRTVQSLCHYFLETMALNHGFIGFPPSMQAAAAYFLATKTIYNGEWVCTI